MLFTIEIVTTYRITVDRYSMQDAESNADKLAAEINSHHHHGEKTTVRVMPVDAVVDSGKRLQT